MRKIVFGLLLLIGCINATNLDLEEYKKLPILASSNIELIDIQELEGYEKEGWVHINAINKATNQKISIFTDTKNVMIGRGFNAISGKEYKFPVDFNKHKKNAAFTIGTGDKEYFLFTDPECPYCLMFDKKISAQAKEKLKLYVYLYPLNFHLAANSMSMAILSQPKEKRAEYASYIMEGQNELTSLIKELDKYSPEMYIDLLRAMNDSRLAQVMPKYIKAIESAYNVKLDSKEKQLKFFAKKVDSFRNNKAYVKLKDEFNNTNTLVTRDFTINGTPSLFESNGVAIQDINAIFYQNQIVNFEKIKEISQGQFSIKAGEGKKKLYVFTSTQCPHCINQFKDISKIDSMLKNYDVRFILMPTGGDPQKAFLELTYIYSQPKEKQFEIFKEMMTGQFDSKKLDSFKLDQNVQNAIIKHLQQDVQATLVSSTPFIVDENGNVLKEVK